MFIIFLIFIILLQIDERSSFDVLPKNDYDSFDRYETLEDRKRADEYQMLMNYERQKSKLQKTSDSEVFFSNLLVIETNDTVQFKDIAEKYGLAFIRKVFEDENFYLFRRLKCRKRCKRQAEEFFQQIEQHPGIRWTSRQSFQNRYRRIPPLENDESNKLLSEVEELVFREVQNKLSNATLQFNDPLFEEQWYLDSKSSEEYLFRTAFHPIPENSHGTRCAAIAAGVANNGVCGVGVAFEARVGGIRLLDDSLTDVQEALSLVHASEHVDIYTASWGPKDTGTEVDGPKILTRMAFVKGTSMGRQGKGSIYVWAAGNGGGYYDNCSLDGYASSPFTLTIGALTEEGLSTFYSEPCPAIIASTYVGGRAHEIPTKESWKEDKKKIKVVVPEGRGKCKATFQGTSAAAPMAAGVVALTLQANPNLTWRDVQHLIIRTSRIPTTEENGWFTNGAGYKFHPKIGSGVLDAHALVMLAKKWKPVANLRIWSTPAKRTKRLLPPRKTTFIFLQILKSSMQAQSRIDEIETVVITINLRHARRGYLEMILESPSGTPSPILPRRPYDNKTTGFDHWDFVSLHFWGEDPEGIWKLRVSNHNERISGYIDYLSMMLFGTGNS